MIFAGLCFALMLASVKLVRAELSTLEVLYWRGLVAAPLSLLPTLGRSLRIHNRRLMAGRVFFGMCAMWCYYTAARIVPLADLSLITRLQPVVVALLAPIFLGAKERSGRRLWGLLVLGIAGCAILLGPQLALGMTGVLWMLGALLSGGGAHIALRGLGATEDSRVVVFWTQVIITSCVVALLLLTAGALPALPSTPLVLPLMSIGLLATAGQLLLTRAYALDRASVVAASSNVMPVWAIILDLAVFAIPPSWPVLVGGALILAASFGLIFSRPPDNDPS